MIEESSSVLVVSYANLYSRSVKKVIIQICIGFISHTSLYRNMLVIQENTSDSDNHIFHPINPKCQYLRFLSKFVFVLSPQDHPKVIEADLTEDSRRGSLPYGFSKPKEGESLLGFLASQVMAN